MGWWAFAVPTEFDVEMFSQYQESHMSQFRRYHSLLAAAIFAANSGLAMAGMDEAKSWIDKEFQPSTLSKEQQIEEMKWFVEAAKPFQGMEIKVISERIDTHWYEASVMAKAFHEITGIKVIHELTGEDDVVKKIQTQTDMDLKLYDAYINDSDLIGTHYRSQKVVSLTDYMAGEGKDVTLPTLDLDDFMSLSFTMANSTSCQTSNSPTCTGIAPTGLRARICRTNSAPFMVMNSASRLTGAPMKTSQNSSRSM
jgi:glycerol transport system substrate-binding protein